ncbi:MAG: glycosyltransferase family 2 protein [Pirellulales bacterium]|nr:glycosyltransferase family 2 protein [Pirellulales bacterium]
MAKLPITVIILTLNEEFNLPGAIESVKGWAEEVFVVDSCSTDRTVDIALEHGVGIVQRPFTNYSDQWNWAIDNLPIKTEWMMKLDADERVNNELKEEICEVLSTDPEEAAFVIPVRNWFMGKPIHTKVYVVRLWRKNKSRFSDVIVNEHLIVDGITGRLQCHIEHHDSPDLHHWCEKQNRYTTMEAIMRVRGDAMATTPKFFGSPLERRMYLKKIFFSVPFRYQLQWIYEIFVRGAWRDGFRGLTCARGEIVKLRMIELKVKEIKTTGRIPEEPKAPHGDYDPRILASDLQKLVFSDNRLSD